MATPQASGDRSSAPTVSPPTGPARPVGLLVACCLGMFMSFIDVTATIATLNAIQVDLEVAPADLSWVSSTYTLVVAVGVLSGGILGERFGLRRVFLVGVALLVLGSLVVFTSGTFAQVLLGRGISGLGGALILPTSLAIIVAAFADEKRRAVMIAIWATASGVGLAVGPLAGGLLVILGGWHSAYLINAVLAFVTAGVTLYAVPETRMPQRSLDLPGQVLVVVGLSCLIYGIAAGGRAGYGSPTVIAALVVAAVVLTVFVVVEARSREPMLDVRMMRSSGYTTTLVVSAVSLFCFVGVMFMEVLFLQRVQELDSLDSGVVLLAAMSSFVVGTAVSGGLSTKVDGARLLLVGTLMVGVAAVILAQQRPDSTGWLIPTGLALLGLGSGFVVAPSTSAAINIVGKEQEPAATAAVTAFRQVGSVLGAAIAGSVLTLRFIGDLPGRLAEAGVPPEEAEGIVKVAREGGQSGDAVPPEVAEAIGIAFSNGVQAGMWLIAGVAFSGSLLIVLFLLRGAKRPVGASRG